MDGPNACVVQVSAISGAVDLMTLQKEVEQGLRSGQLDQNTAAGFMAANAGRVLQVTLLDLTKTV